MPESDSSIDAITDNDENMNGLKDVEALEDNSTKEFSGSSTTNSASILATLIKVEEETSITESQDLSDDGYVLTITPLNLL